ncbi:MAG: dienelactone hydrolase family protein [Verrucomicrobiota bacterium]|nr:dienelactone hydrolase family protein [Verrucomicrobiota bacterium]
MTIIDHESADLSTPGGPMRTFISRPAAEGKYPGIILFSEIFQVTGPIRRTAALLAGHGFLVAAPEIFHEFEPAGGVLPYDAAGADRGNWCKVNKPLQAYDDDARAVIDFLGAHPRCTGKLGSMGICIGGHLNFRCCLNPGILAGVSLYATDIHKLENHPRGLGPGMADDSLARARGGEIQGELLMIWGRQDPHVPFEARAQIHEALEQSGALYQWIELNGAHAFLRDEGPRYNPVLAQQSYGLALELYHRKLGEGDRPAGKTGAGAGETRH